jgi:hypothetical protein
VTLVRRLLLPISAAVAGLGVGAPVPHAGAALLPGGIVQGGQANAPALCQDANAPSGIGDAGATVNQVCGANLVFVGPNVGQVASTVGPTVIGSTLLAPVTVAAGPVAVSWLP